jgi:cobalamin biosynthesis Mg chelatase CobN
MQWANAMAAQGSGGAYEISQRMTALIGWSGTADFTDEVCVASNSTNALYQKSRQRVWHRVRAACDLR